MITKSNEHRWHGDETPSPWIMAQLHRLSRGARILDLACGSGRHARPMAAAGYAVDAVDRDAALVAGLHDVAGISVLVHDLEADAWPYPLAAFDAVVVSRYLHRPLFPQLLASLRPGGWMIYETFMRGQERYGRPSNPDFLLRPWELLAWARDGRLEIVDFAQGVFAVGRLAMLQRLCARRPA